MSHHSTLELGSTMHLPGQALEHKAYALTPVREPQLSSFSLDDINGHFNLAAPSHPKLDADGKQMKIVHVEDKASINPLVKILRIEFD